MSNKLKTKRRQERALQARRASRERRDIEAFMATPEGQEAIKAKHAEALEQHARELASQILEYAHRRVFERTLAEEVKRWSGLELDALLALAPELRSRAATLSEREGVAMRRVALEIEETAAAVERQVGRLAQQRDQAVALAEAEGKELAEDETLAETHRTIRRGCALALANVFARVSVVDQPLGDWTREVVEASPTPAAP